MESIVCTLRCAKVLFPDLEFPVGAAEDSMCSIPLSIMTQKRLTNAHNDFGHSVKSNCIGELS
jgi:hypothetical protein